MKLGRLVNLLFFVVILLAAIFMLALTSASLIEFIKDQDPIYPPSFFGVLVIPGLFSILALFALFRILKLSSNDSTVLSIKYPLRSAFFVICLIFSLFMIYNIFNDPPPELFPFNDSEAVYSITKIDGIYYLNYKATSDRNKYYVCEWPESGEKYCGWETHKDISGVAIGKSPVDLESFLNHNLRLDGSFAYSDKQCIVNICKDLNSRLVVDINSIEAISPQK